MPNPTKVVPGIEQLGIKAQLTQLVELIHAAEASANDQDLKFSGIPVFLSHVSVPLARKILGPNIADGCGVDYRVNAHWGGASPGVLQSTDKSKPAGFGN
jgi:hypothetical protein